MKATGKRSEAELTCQSFRQGCCGCCINMRWSDSKILSFLEANTEAASRIFRNRTVRFRDLVRLHWSRKGWLDHLLAFWLVPLTFGLSALLWRRFWGSCQFAGLLDPTTGRVGCLIHPLRIGQPDLRKHAFPLIPTLGCDRELMCPMLRDPNANLGLGVLEVSRKGARSPVENK